MIPTAAWRGWYAAPAGMRRTRRPSLNFFGPIFFARVFPLARSRRSPAARPARACDWHYRLRHVISPAGAASRPREYSAQIRMKNTDPELARLAVRVGQALLRSERSAAT